MDQQQDSNMQHHMAATQITVALEDSKVLPKIYKCVRMCRKQPLNRRIFHLDRLDGSPDIQVIQPTTTIESRNNFYSKVPNTVKQPKRIKVLLQKHVKPMSQKYTKESPARNRRHINLKHLSLDHLSPKNRADANRMNVGKSFDFSYTPLHQPSNQGVPDLSKSKLPKSYLASLKKKTKPRCLTENIIFPISYNPQIPQGETRPRGGWLYKSMDVPVSQQYEKTQRVCTIEMNSFKLPPIDGNESQDQNQNQFAYTVQQPKRFSFDVRDPPKRNMTRLTSDYEISKINEEEQTKTKKKLVVSRYQRDEPCKKDHSGQKKSSPKKEQQTENTPKFFNNTTLYFEMGKKEPIQRLRQSVYSDRKMGQTFRTIRNNHVPTKEELPQFIRNYKSMDIAFDLSEVIKSPKFRILEGKNALYIGEVSNGMRHGLGVSISDKGVFEGLFIENNKIKGSESNSEGLYKGSFKNGLRQGFGEFIWKNKETYKGEWHAGMKHGKGTWKGPLGDSYEGDWVYGKQQGTGKHIHQGSVYEGQFKAFLKHGKGIQIFSNGDRYIGEYEQGKPHGCGEYIWSTGFKYKGDFKQGVREGRGVLEQKDSVYTGQFRNDCKQGEGEMRYRDGRVERGRFQNNELLLASK